MAHAHATTTTTMLNGEKPRRPGSPPDPHAWKEPHVPVRTYILIFAALMVLMFLTVAAAFLPHRAMGNWSIIIALGLTFTDYLTRPWLPQSAGWQDHPLRAKTALPDPVPADH